VLPNVHSQQGFVACCQRCACGAHVDDVNAAVSFLDQPSPTRTKITHSAFHESFFESSIRAKFGVDGSSQSTGGLATAMRLHAIPEKGVVPDLSRVVVNTAAGFLDDFFQRH